MKQLTSKIYMICCLWAMSQFAFAQSVQFEPVHTKSPFVASSESTMAFADVNGDQAPDLLISTYNGEDCAIKLYTNDGKGNYQNVTQLPFEKLSRSSVAFADVNGDQAPDLLLNGFHAKSFQGITRLYLNDGKGGFAEQKEAALQGVDFGAIAFADVDNDGDQDIFLSGVDAQLKTVARMYINNGKGNFQETTISVQGLARGAATFADVDGDQLPDLLLTGVNAAYVPTAQLYKNKGNGQFTLVKNTPFTGVHGSAAAFADVDNDQDLDVLITGLNKLKQATTILYQNDGLGNFERVENTPFQGTSDGAVAFADIDGDRDADVLITGLDQQQRKIATLYQNQGNGQFALLKNMPFAGAGLGSIGFADIDQDNDLDVMITGANNEAKPTTQLYKNGHDFNAVSSKKPQTAFAHLKVYPVPSLGKVTIEATGFAGTYQLVDLNGQKIAAGKINARGRTPIVLQQRNRVYMLRVTREDGQVFTYKLINK
ncbi:T9SS type A sorting domain-containing protein [Microscilla marina]|uniref:FG-GAP repeat domain protein n=1 Tax=Microscilla marina ATCC 23134 TaxID=313606 RepID=A1ZDK9_MICM2|nr:T9SS type A sorting domain-containing protein [Microscilla marina]EAY31748.1 FG-GAP repeat domain protein [Microscilla marina ATCC 23134]